MKTGIYFGAAECEIQGPIVVYGAQSVNADDVIRLASIIIDHRRGREWKIESFREKILDSVLDAVERVVGVDRSEIFAKTRRRLPTQARHMVVSAFRDMSRSTSATSIGRSLGRDHSTILHSLRVHQDYMVTDPAYKRAYGEVMEWLKSEA